MHAKPPPSHRAVKAGVFLAIAVLAGLLLWRSHMPSLEFSDIEHLEGFRVLKSNSGRIPISPTSGPLIGLDRNTEPKPARIVSNLCRGLFGEPNDPSIGPKNAVVRIVEFTDYQCPYCRSLSKLLRSLQKRDSRIRVIFKEWPILGSRSTLAARAALAAHLQGDYLVFHDALMAGGILPNMALVADIAGRAGSDSTTVYKDMNSAEITSVLTRNAALAAHLGLFGTPSLVVGQTVVHGAISSKNLGALIELEAAVDPNTMC